VLLPPPTIGGGFRRDRDREDNTQAGKDDDWRSGMGQRSEGGGGGFGDRERRGGFGDRDRRGGDDRDGGGWRRGGDDAPSERPKLNLKPRSKPGEEGADKDEAPWRASKKDEVEATPKDDDKKPAFGGGKYIPPGQRKKMEEEEKQKETRQREEEQRRADDRERRAREDEEKERRRQEVMSKRQAEEEKKAAEQRSREEKKRAAEEEKAAAEKAKKVEEKKKLEAEARERREQLMRESKAQKMKAKGTGDKEVCDLEKVSAFVEACEEVLKGSGSVKSLVKKVDSILTEDELSTVKPVAGLLELLLQQSRRKKDDDVIDLVAEWAPVLNCLCSQSGVRRFKVKLLIEAQRAASKMGLPRLSPASALLEVFFDGLYRAEVIEEDYFEMWAVNNDDTPGKTNAMFQVTFFLEWLRTAKLEGEESSEEEEGEGEESEDEEDDDEEVDEDIEANVPRGVGAKALVR